MGMIFGDGTCAAFIANWTRIAPAIVEIAKKSTNKHVKALLIQYSKTLLQHNDNGITFNED
jgi:hypothetical protein